MSRKYTNDLLERVAEGTFDAGFVLSACLKYMSEAEVKDMMEMNELLLMDLDDGPIGEGIWR